MNLYRVRLCSVGNIDFGQNPERPYSPLKWATSFSLAGCSRACLDYISKYELGGGNWNGGQIFKGGVQIARVSYNGRIWEGEGFGNGEEIKFNDEDDVLRFFDGLRQMQVDPQAAENPILSGDQLDRVLTKVYSGRVKK